jgi:hypothetical protein
MKVITKVPCPKCGKNDDIVAAHGDPESFSIGGK